MARTWERSSTSSILMMENRSYDHYFGAYPKGRGFDDHREALARSVCAGLPGQDRRRRVPQAQAAAVPPGLDGRVRVHRRPDPRLGPAASRAGTGERWISGSRSTRSRSGRARNGAMTMGYYERPDLPFHWALADHFTLCDAYHCSILGPTHPNRLMANSGTIDPEGQRGGPVVKTNSSADTLWNCTWPTMQEVLEDAGVSWKVYSPSNAGVSGKYAALTGYPTWTPGFYDPVTNPRRDGHLRSRAAVLHGVPRPELAAVRQGVSADVPERLRRRCQVRHAAEGVVDDPAARLRRAPVGFVAQRGVLHLTGAGRAGREPQGVVQDRARRDVRRERWLV